MKNSLSLLALVLFSVTGFSQVRWVTTLADDTIPGTLRYEIDHAPAQAQIRFVDSILPNGSDTLHLDSVIYITKAVDIRGYMRNGDTVFISGDSATQIFSIDMTTAGSGLRDLKLDSLAIIKGFSSIGGAIEMVHIEHTEITNCYFSHCSSIYGGGAIDCDRVGGNPWAFLIFSNNTFEENEGPSIVRIVDVQQIRVSDIVLKNNASARCFRIAANGKLIATRVYAFNNYEVNPFGANYAITIGADTLMTDSLFAFDNTECGGFSFGGQRQHHNHIYAINNTQPNGSGGIESVWYYSSGTPPTFENCVIKDNTGGLSGGMSMNAMVLKNSIVRNNTSTNFTGVGGIQFGSSTHVSSHIMNCSIDSNSAATGRGGGIYGQPKGLYISGSTIHSNSGATKGGGIYIWDADTLVIHNSFIGDNFGNEYGGVYARFDAYTEVKNSTIAYNVSNQGSGGLFNQGSL
ncbi:MAG: hypothetical protein HWE14_07975, partial [Flavobacteriia bacterium]|nr:hypothetical protein [Flavobacteriia bacterium]